MRTRPPSGCSAARLTQSRARRLLCSPRVRPCHLRKSIHRLARHLAVFTSHAARCQRYCALFAPLDHVTLSRPAALS
ncbi:hypothetical protein DENSPDRAFT_846322 [Dentipellis sp. KUC8613]|nr:hypothetical protein DENSPDRAFT_846187 [Dentipellis sp. KUC8613]KAA1479635.1 hypothetical protein DENSPDRAFT_846322 [Dentipellis sp. KUC8613]